jgi:hypothetical protein
VGGVLVELASVFHKPKCKMTSEQGCHSDWPNNRQNKPFPATQAGTRRSKATERRRSIRLPHNPSARGGGFPGWSYTVGLSDILTCPELIVIGLKENVAHSLLNECARRLQSGVRLEKGKRESGLLSNVESEFRGVERRCLRHTMGYAVWFYGGRQFFSPSMRLSRPQQSFSLGRRLRRLPGAADSPSFSRIPFLQG